MAIILVLSKRNFITLGLTIGTEALIGMGMPPEFAFLASIGITLVANKVGDKFVPKGTSGLDDDFIKGMSTEDAARYEQWCKYAESGLDVPDRVKLMDWGFSPDADFYLKNKSVYDNPDYFNQLTGNTIYPGTNGKVHTKAP